jgi:hypothetical protein
VVVSSEFGPLVISVFLPPTGGPAQGTNAPWLLALGAFGLLGGGVALRWVLRRSATD